MSRLLQIYHIKINVLFVIKKKKSSRMTGEGASLEFVWYWRSKFPGLEKKSRKRGSSSPASTNSVCNSSAVNKSWCVRSFSANISKSLAASRGGFASVSSSASAILSSYLFSGGAATKTRFGACRWTAE